jgi:hypothetical protein
VPNCHSFSALRAAALMAVSAGLSSTAAPAPSPRCALQPEHAAILVMQTPAAVEAKSKGGCPAADYQEKSEGLAGFTIRNLCSRSGETSLGAFLVELSSGRIWEDAAQRRSVDSATLRAARVRVCSMSVRGVVPSLLPHAKPRPRRSAAASRPLASARRP